MSIEEFAQEAIKRLCDRCAEGHHAWPPSFLHDEYEHGVDMMGTTTVGPMVCEATVIHQLLREKGEAA